MFDIDSFSLKEKNILITGASSGIGKSIAIACSEMGANLILLGRNYKRLNETLFLLKGGNHTIKCLDLNNSELLSDFIQGIENIDGLVHCAGIVKTCPVKFINRQDYNNIFNTNIYAPMELTKLLLENKKIKKESSIVFISSVEGTTTATMGNAIYSSSKSALLAYAKVLALELSSRRIRVNSILPAMIRTELFNSIAIGNIELETDEKRYPLGYGSTYDVATATIYLLSKASKWVTGTQLIIDGGLSLR